jgi:hypothetical protein
MILFVDSPGEIQGQNLLCPLMKDVVFLSEQGPIISLFMHPFSCVPSVRSLFLKGECFAQGTSLWTDCQPISYVIFEPSK